MLKSALAGFAGSQSQLVAMPGIAETLRRVNVTCAGGGMAAAVANWATRVTLVGVIVWPVHRPLASSVIVTDSTVGRYLAVSTNSDRPRSKRATAGALTSKAAARVANAVPVSLTPATGLVTVTSRVPTGAVTSTLMLTAVLVLAGSLLADLLYATVDPRIRLD